MKIFINKVMAFALAIALTVVPTMTILATKADAAVMYSHISIFNPNLRASSGKLNCYCNATSADSDTKTNLTVTLQRRKSGTSVWSYVTKWTDTASGTGYAIVDESYPMESGYEYRLYCVCLIKSSGGSTLEREVKYTGAVS